MDCSCRFEFIVNLLVIVAGSVISLIWSETRCRRAFTHVLVSAAFFIPVRSIPLVAVVPSGGRRPHLICHLLKHVRGCLVTIGSQIGAANAVLQGTAMPCRVVVVVERSRRDALHVDAHGLRLLENALQAVDQVLVVVVALVDVKHSQNQLVFVLNQLLQQLNVIRVSESIASQQVHLVHQVLLPLGQWALWPLEVRTEGLRERGQLVGQLNVCDQSVDVDIEHLLDVDVFLEDESLDHACSLLFQKPLLF